MEASRSSRRVEPFRLLAADVFVTDEDRDYSVVAVEPVNPNGVDLSRYGVLRLVRASGKALEGECVSIVQHPRGNTKHAAVRENQVTWLDDDWERGAEPF